MAKNDYHVLVYYILNYLYECLKIGEKPDKNILSLSLYPERIDGNYILYIYKNLLREGYIEGVDIVSVPRLGCKGNLEYIRDYGSIEIRPKGIEYLHENSLIKKAYEVVRDFKPW